VTISLCVVGVVVGMLIAIVTAFYVPTGDGVVSLGVAATVLLLGPYAHFLGRALRSSGAAALPCVAWLIATMLLASTRTEGDLVVTGSTEGIAFLLLGTVSGAVGIGTVKAGIARSDRRAADRAIRDAERVAQEAAEAPSE
jgi:hypothetical protein